MTQRRNKVEKKRSGCCYIKCLRRLIREVVPCRVYFCLPRQVVSSKKSDLWTKLTDPTQPVDLHYRNENISQSSRVRPWLANGLNEAFSKDNGHLLLLGLTKTGQKVCFRATVVTLSETSGHNRFSKPFQTYAKHRSSTHWYVALDCSSKVLQDKGYLRYQNWN